MSYTISYGDKKTGNPTGCIIKAMSLDDSMDGLKDILKDMKPNEEMKIFIWREC